MTGEQRAVLLTALKEVHDLVHDQYPKGPGAEGPAGRRLRNQLLVVDLAVHLADEVVGMADPNEQQVVERMANLLYAVRLIAPGYPLERAAEVLLSEPSEPDAISQV
jgi:hypothetical protein